MPTITIHNVETGEVIERELTAAEVKELQKKEAEDAAKMAERAAAEAAKQAIINKLGITADEAKLLLG